MRKMQLLHPSPTIRKESHNNLIYLMELLRAYHRQGRFNFPLLWKLNCLHSICPKLMFIWDYGPRSGSLVDYEDDEDDEDYKPPPRKQPEASEEDEGTMESFRLKRKLPPKDREPDHVKKQKWFKMNPKPKDSVFAALCSTLSQAVLPAKKTAINVHDSPHAAEGRMSSGDDDQEKESNVPRTTSLEDNSSATAAEENHVEIETADSRNCSDHLQGSADNRQLDGEECQLAPPKSSPEMAVSGS